MTIPRTLVLSIALVVAVGLWRPPAHEDVRYSGVHRERFWAAKASIRGSVRLALVGDSRVYQGLSPAEMTETFHAHGVAPGPIANLGFSGVCLCDEYLAFADRALSPAGPPRTIVLGVTPHSLTEHARRANGFLTEARRARIDTLQRLYVSPALDFLEPIDVDALLCRSPSDGGPRYAAHFWPDGWVAARAIAETDRDLAVHEYVPVFTASKVDPQLVDALLAVARRWSEGGVHVAAFRPPVSPAMRRVEDDLAGYDEAAFRERFTAAGGSYLTFEEPFESYDGSHLSEPVARTFSRALAAKLAR